MSRLRSLQIWRQTNDMAPTASLCQEDNDSKLSLMGHKLISCPPVSFEESASDEAKKNHRRLKRIRTTNISRRTEVRNSTEEEQVIGSNVNPTHCRSPLLLLSSMPHVGGRRRDREEVISQLPVAPPLPQPIDRYDLESSCQSMINLGASSTCKMLHRATTSQARKTNNHSAKVIKRGRNERIASKRKQEMVGFLARLTCSLVLCLSGLTFASKAEQQQQQRFEVQPELQYLVQNGQEVRLRCLVRNRQGECLWLRNGRAIGAIAKKYVFLRQPEDGDCSLVIRNVSVQQDDGQWQCQVTPSDLEQDTLQSRETQLVVLVPPERPQIKNATNLYSSTHKQLVLEEKAQAIVVCEVRGGNPMPQIEWILDGKNITKEASQSSSFPGQPQASSSVSQTSQRITQSRLRLNDIKRTMNGKNLTCVGVHQTGGQSSSVELDVEYLPSVSVPQREYSIVEGSPLSISCQVDSNPPPSDVSWRLSNDASGKQSQPSIRQGALLNFERTSRELNQNTFQCLAQNSYGISSPADVKLNVLYPPTALNTSSPHSVPVGTEAQLSCLFEGNPKPEIRWLFTDPLSRSLGPVLIDNPDKKQPQFLTIRNVTYRNEGDYHCEARNQINGQEFYMRSSNIILDVFGEPQFLVKSPFVTKAIEGTKSEISLTFCSDPAPNKVFWYFGSMRLDVRLNSTNNGHQLPPVMPIAHPGGTNPKSNIYQRFQVHPLQSLQTRNSSPALAATCFEAKLTILEPELTDQRDFSLVVANERGLQTGTIRLRVSSPLSPMLMITSAFVTIFGLFLLSLIAIFFIKRRHDSLSANVLQSGNGSQQSGEKGAGSVEHLVNGNANNGTIANGNTNGLLQHAQTRGIVNGTGNGLANGAGNPNNGLLAEESTKHHLNLMSMASSDTSGDQKQLLTNSSSDRNSPTVSGSTNNTNTCADFNVNSSSSVGSDHSSPSPLNHISVEHEFHHDHHNTDGSTYQPAESVTNGAELSPHSPLSRHANSALIYANLDYSEQHPSMVTIASNNMAHHHHPQHQHQQQHSPDYRSPSQEGRVRQQVPADISMSRSPTGSVSTIDSRHLQSSSSIRRSVANRQSLSRSTNSNTDDNNPLPSPKGRPSVGATIAKMNSLAAAAAAASSSTLNPNSNMMSSPNTGVLNGAIQQQLAGSKQIRKAGPPKPPKPSIQQRSRFYQQHLAGTNLSSLISTSPNHGSDENLNNNGLVIIGSHNNHPRTSTVGADQQTASNDQLAVEYSRITFPARAEL